MLVLLICINACTECIEPTFLVRHSYTVLPSGVLQVSEVSKTEAGLYRCHAVNTAKERHSDEALLTVLPPVAGNREVTLLARPKDQTAVGGDSVIFECLATGVPAPTIQWTKLVNDEATEVELGKHISLVGQSNLRIDDVWERYEGAYVCTASNGEGSVVTAQAQLTVLVLPYIWYMTENKESGMLHTLRFYCRVQGVPLPTITWLKNGEVLENNGHVELKGDELVIAQGMASDSGLYQCFAENRVGMDQDTVRLDVEPAADAPDRPTGVVARTINSSGIELSWDASSTYNGYSVIAYSVHFLPTKGGPELQKVIENTTCTISELQPHTNYTFYVVSYSTKGGSQHSDVVTQATAEDVPRELPHVTVTGSSDSSMTVTWELMTPDMARGVITTYKLMYRQHGHATQHIIELPAPARGYTITGLKPETQYEVLVLARTVKGFPALDDTWPWVTHATLPQTAAGQSLDMQLQVINSSSLMVTWSAPMVNSSYAPITGYKLLNSHIGAMHNDTEHKVIILGPTEKKYILGQLAPDTWYEVRLWMYNNKGDSAATIASERTPKSDDMAVPTGQVAPSPPEGIDAEPYNDSCIRLTWDKVHPSLNVTRYHIRFRKVDSDITQQITSEVEVVFISGLLPHTMYEFRVSCETEEYQGPFSNAVRCRSLPGRPSAPQNLQWSLQGPALVELRWQPPWQTNGVIVCYIIYYTVDTSAIEWLTKIQNGSYTRVAMDNLQRDTLYYFKLLAATSAGPGPTTSVIKVKTPTIRTGYRGSHDQELGIITGFAIGISCIIICIVIIFVRSRYCTGRQATPPAVVSVNGVNHNNTAPHNELCEMESYTPMIHAATYKNKPTDSQMAYYASQKADKNGYVPMNGLRPVYKTNGRMTTFISEKPGHDQPQPQKISPEDPDDPYQSNYTSLDDIDRSSGSSHSPYHMCCDAVSPDETVCSDNSRHPLCTRCNSYTYMLPNGRAGSAITSPGGGQSNYEAEEDVWLRHSEADTRGQQCSKHTAKTVTSGSTKRV
ncbi:Immunoglobulin superfamily DCC subclass member 4 [Lamellibrachia satsuma]|nr:Immunoglobulin superfamily DCC subclass member 4 [Lamellibrachia satsuma]